MSRNSIGIIYSMNFELSINTYTLILLKLNLSTSIESVCNTNNWSLSKNVQSSLNPTVMSKCPNPKPISSLKEKDTDSIDAKDTVANSYTRSICVARKSESPYRVIYFQNFPFVHPYSRLTDVRVILIPHHFQLGFYREHTSRESLLDRFSRLREPCTSPYNAADVVG